jgi:hypothetical protein
MDIASAMKKSASRAGCIVLALGCAGAIAASPALADGHVGDWYWLNPQNPSSVSFIVSAAKAGSPSTFNASGSVVQAASGTVYHWKFGDGTSADTATATASHIYAIAGFYTVTLTETVTTVVSFYGVHYTHESASGAASQAVVVPPAPPPPPPPPPPAVQVSTSPVTIGPRGNAWIWLLCPRTAVGGCHGAVTLQLARGWHPGPWDPDTRAVASRCARGCRALGSTNYQARAGQRVHIRVHIASFDRGLLARAHQLPVQLTVTSVSGARTASSTAKLTLKARQPPQR